MNETRHDFLAGARLPLHQRRRLRGGYLCGLLENGHPFRRASDRAAEPRAEVELRCERLHAHFEVLGAGTCLRTAALGIRELLMGERQADAGGDVPRDRHIPEAEGEWLFRPECEVQWLEAGGGTHDQ